MIDYVAELDHDYNVAASRPYRDVEFVDPFKFREHNLKQRFPHVREATEISHRWVNDVRYELQRAYHKLQIEDLFESGRTLYFSDIAQELGLDLREVVSICRELMREHKIHVQKDR